MIQPRHQHTLPSQFYIYYQTAVTAKVKSKLTKYCHTPKYGEVDKILKSYLLHHTFWYCLTRYCQIWLNIMKRYIITVYLNLDILYHSSPEKYQAINDALLQVDVRYIEATFWLVIYEFVNFDFMNECIYEWSIYEWNSDIAHLSEVCKVQTITDASSFVKVRQTYHKAPEILAWKYVKLYVNIPQVISVIDTKIYQWRGPQVDASIH